MPADLTWAEAYSGVHPAELTWAEAYNGVDVTGPMLHSSEAHPHGQLAMNALRVQQVVLHVAADGLHLAEVLIPHQEGKLHLAGLVEVDDDLGLGNAGLIGDDLLRQHLQATGQHCSVFEYTDSTDCFTAEVLRVRSHV